MVRFLLCIIVSITILTSCKKGVIVDDNIVFSTIKFDPLNIELNPKTVSFNGDSSIFKSGQLIIPFEGKDSINLKISFWNENSLFNNKIPIKPGLNSLAIYYLNPSEKIIQIGSHPLEGVKEVEGNKLLKFVNLSEVLSPNNNPIHLLVYGFKDLENPNGPVYSDLPIDTVKNITSEMPDEFKPLRKFNTQIYIKTKVVKSDFSDLIINGKKVYLYYSEFGNSGENVLIYYMDEKVLELTIDVNTGNELEDAYSLMPKLLMSK